MTHAFDIKRGETSVFSSKNDSSFVLFLLCFRVHLFIDALWSPAGKGLTSWLSFVMSNCEVVTFTLVSWVTCDA